MGTLEIEELSNYREVVSQNFEEFISQRQFNTNQIRFLRAVQNVFLKKPRLEMVDLYEELLDGFGEIVWHRIYPKHLYLFSDVKA